MANGGLSIVIVSYRNLEVLKNCLDSVFAMNDIGERLQVIVVEQSPDDGIYRHVRENYPAVEAIRAENCGFGAGNNRGVEAAKHEYLLLLNPDTVLTEPVAAFAIDKFERNPSLGLFGVQLLNGDGTPGSSFQEIVPFGLQAKVRCRIAQRTGRFRPGGMYIEGADMFLRREALRRAGGFDEAVFMYGEEIDLCLSLRRMGYDAAFDGSRKIIHLQGACSPDRLGAVYERQLNSLGYVYRKHGLPFGRMLRAEYRSQTLKKCILRCLGRRGVPGASAAEEKRRVLKAAIKGEMRKQGENCI